MTYHNVPRLTETHPAGPYRTYQDRIKSKVAAFIRKNLITLNAAFLPQGFVFPPNTPWPFPGGGPINGDWCYSTVPPQNPAPTNPPVQPTEVIAVLSFTNPGGSSVTTTIPMVLSVSGWFWSCQWDSSASGQGDVTWVVFGSGAAQGANQGSFRIIANSVNTF